MENVVLITGAAGGLGSALARRYARSGVRLALFDRPDTGVADLAREIEAGSCPARASECDVTSFDQVRSAVDDVVRHWGGVDVLVNNAGITHLGLARDTDVDTIRKVMEVNFFGAVHCTKAALPSLLERRGQIVVLSSVAGIAPLATRTGYSASKHALHGFFESLRAEHAGDGLRVMMVCPSFIDTAIGDHALGPHGDAAAATARTGVRNPARPEDVADAIVAAAAANRRLLLTPREARLSYWLARLAPALFERVMIRRTM
jgi:NAD(P)-dependent dehydrogenase (short-subunit alcohol dehydrogenase family)